MKPEDAHRALGLIRSYRGKLILRPGKSPLTHPTNSQCVSGSGTEAGREADPLTDSEAVKFRSGYAAWSYSIEISLPV